MRCVFSFDESPLKCTIASVNPLVIVTEHGQKVDVASVRFIVEDSTEEQLLEAAGISFDRAGDWYVTDVHTVSCDYSWAECMCGNTIKFCHDVCWTVCPACSRVYEIIGKKCIWCAEADIV